jgi:hypothetical protein
MKKMMLLILFVPILIRAQDHPLDIFKPLVIDSWFAEGQWGDGSSFKQEIRFEYALNNKIVKVKSLGFTDEKQTIFGVRNHGIRQYDEASDQIKFWEFDVFGGLTKGIVESDGKNIVYRYDYGGNLVTEMWIYQNDNSYQFVVGIYDNGEWKQKFLDTEFNRQAQ